MSLDARLDLYAIKTLLERANDALDLRSVLNDALFVGRSRKNLLPLPLLDRADGPDPSGVLPPFRRRPAHALDGKRVAVVSTGGGGAAVALAGIKRAFEEAGIEPAEIVGCSGGAIWGAMWAGGMTSGEMVDFSLSWRPQDYVDVEWLKLPRYVVSALRGYTGGVRGEAIERLFDRRMARMRCDETVIPITTIVYNMDLGRVEYFGSDRTPSFTIGELVRVAIALPLFIESVPVGDHLYVDGGIIELWPAQPVIEDPLGFDHVFGVNLMLPQRFEPRDITGWKDRLGGILEASRQLQQGYHLELARRARAQLGDKLTLIEPVSYEELRGTSFYDLFLDRSQWPRLIRQGYDAATAALAPYRKRTAVKA